MSLNNENSYHSVNSSEVVDRDQPSAPADEASPAKHGQGGGEEERISIDRGGGCGLWWFRWKHTWIIVGMFFFRNVAGVCLGPILPELKKDHFGGDREAAFWSTLLQGISSFLGLLLAPFFGYLMDVVGRRPLFRLALICNMVPPVFLLVFYPNPFPFMIAQSIAGLVISSYVQAYIADNYPEEAQAPEELKGMRLRSFAAVRAGMELPTAFALLTFAFGDWTLIILSNVLQFIALVYTWFLVKESLPQEHVRPFRFSEIENPFKAMIAVLKGKISTTAIFITALFTIAQNGIVEIYLFYLNDRIGFTKGDNSILYIEVGLMMPVTLLIVVPVMTRVFRFEPCTLIMISCVACVGQMATMSSVTAKWQVYAFGVPLTSLVYMSMPSLTAIVADESEGPSQGRKQSGLGAIHDFAAAIAPFLFGQIYSHVPREWGFLPFAICALMCIPAFLMTLKLRSWIREKKESQIEGTYGDSNGFPKSSQSLLTKQILSQAE